MSIGLTLPYVQTTSSIGYLAASDTQLQATYYNLKSLLLTDWGERPNHPDLGCNLSEFLFEQSSEETSIRIDERVRSQVQKWLPYVNVDNVSATYPRENILKLQVWFSLAGYNSDQKATIELTVGGTM